MKCKVIDDDMIEIDGNMYKIKKPYILAKQMEKYRVAYGFTSLITGHRWADFVIVGRCNEISEDEIKK